MEPVHNLLTPLPQGNEVLLFDPLYDQIRLARTEEDEGLSRGIWVVADPKKANWLEVERLCEHALKERSKDLQIAAWLWEAWVKLYGIKGFKEGCNLIAELFKNPESEPQNAHHKTYILEWCDQAIASQLWRMPISETYSLSQTIALQGEIKSHLNFEELVHAQKVFQHFCDSIPDLSFNKIGDCLEALQKILTAPQLPKGVAPSIEVSEKNEVPVMSQEEAYEIIGHISDYLKQVDPNNLTPYLLDLSLLWQKKNIVQILEDIQVGDTDAHKLIRTLFGTTK